MRQFTLVFILIIATCRTYAQHPGDGSTTISGRVVDSASHSPIEYATVVLLSADLKAINGATANDSGVFELTKVPPGTYAVQVDFIGYREKLIAVTVSGEKATQEIGSIRLGLRPGSLNQVVVSGRRDIIENRIDKIVFNAANDITSQGGVALDILKKVPQVSVDINGNVEVQGNSGVRFLIDGKPSAVFGSNITDVLASIPASQIQSIEVITSPGAKYDAQGTGGIINIILKKSTVKGLNGSIALSAGTRLENGSVNVTSRNGNIGLNAFVSGNYQISSSVLTDLNRNTSNPSDNSHTLLAQHGISDFTRGGLQSGIGFDWDVSKHDNITASFGYRRFGNHSNGVVDQISELIDASGSPMSDYTNSIVSNSRFRVDLFDWSLDYKKTFKKKDQELDIRYSASQADGLVSYEQGQSLVDGGALYSGLHGRNPGTTGETDISIDYTQPFGKDITIETGAKTELVDIGSIASVNALDPATLLYVPNAGQSYDLSYKSYVYAGYASGSFSLFNWLKVKTGLRLEHTDIKAAYSGTTNVQVPSYNTLVPSAIISHDIDKSSSIKLSYSYRIERPDFRDLNPFLNLSDPHNVSTGNPALRPEIGNKVELGYSKSFGKGGNIYATLFYNINTSDIKQFTTFYPELRVGDSVYTNVSLTAQENIGQEHRRGGSLFASLPVTKSFNIRTNIQAYDRYIVNTLVQDSKINSFEYRVNLNGSYQFPHDLVVEAFGNFSSRRIGVQGKYPSYMSYNFALRKQFFHKNASLAITATNIFSKYIEQRTELTGENFTVSGLQQVPYRSFGLSFTYKFGKLEFKKNKDDNSPEAGVPGIGY